MSQKNRILSSEIGLKICGYLVCCKYGTLYIGGRLTQRYLLEEHRKNPEYTIPQYSQKWILVDYWKYSNQKKAGKEENRNKEQM